jgi:hypothetical protein
MFLDFDGAMNAATSTSTLGMAHCGDPTAHFRADHDLFRHVRKGRPSVHQPLPGEQGSLKFS